MNDILRVFSVLSQSGSYSLPTSLYITAQRLKLRTSYYFPNLQLTGIRSFKYVSERRHSPRAAVLMKEKFPSSSSVYLLNADSGEKPVHQWDKES